MTTTTDTDTEWTRLALAATTAEEHACRVHAAALIQAIDPDDTTARHTAAAGHYRRLLGEGTYAHLRRQRPSVRQVVALIRIATAGPEGLEGHLLDTMTRAALIRHDWATAQDRDGRRVDHARDWACTLLLTRDGAAHADAALINPAALAPAAPLAGALRQVADRTPERRWPGRTADRIAAETLGLVTWHTTQAMPPVHEYHRLTTTGARVLAAWERRAKTPTAANPTQARLLGELIDGNRERRMGLYPSETYDAAEVHGWIVWGEADEHGRRPLDVTDAGRAAHAAARSGAGRPTVQRRSVANLSPGQRVRMANRTGWRNVGPEWVTVEQVEYVARQGRKPGGWRVFYRTPQGAVRGYADGAVFNARRTFEIK